MGRTLPSITQAFLQEQQSLARFRRALRREDPRALDDLLGSSRQHLAAAAYASHLLPFEVMLLAMLVEQHKQVLHLQQEIEVLQSTLRDTPSAGGAGAPLTCTDSQARDGTQLLDDGNREREQEG